ncbi:hypothetical protein [Cerasicoccus arenae]|uniref:Uncharacterized protein n=1 Tax=Cerasicoccus arenae TaxID=424488 RepID=A0A8J3D8U0_9BACT|nr:hypothetical protein [Cerasicoccus arenae]MBK1856981.1 hypothetical protein [Cerasicoccus arenae]GHB90203.1 hypothetical protein GCM10007047_01050 [Cerasicoccus arenae]
MSTESFQRINKPAEENLSAEEQAIRQMEEHAELLTRGKLLKHLRKKHKLTGWALQEFAMIASEVSEIETGMHEHGVLTKANWRYKTTKQSGAKVVASLLIGLFAALIPGDEEIKIEYTTVHRLEHSTIRWYFWRKILLTFLYVVMIALGTISIIWLIIGVALLLDRTATQEEKMWGFIPLIISPLCFFIAHKLKKSIIPPMLRIYGGNHFELVSLKPAEPTSLADIR